MAAESVLLWAGAGFVIALGLVLSLARFAWRLGLLDAPGGRKDHPSAVPLTGGLAIFAAFGLVLLLGPDSGLPLPVLLSAMAAMLALGLIDDRVNLSPVVQLPAQFTIALLGVVAGGLIIPHLGSLPVIGVVGLGILAVPFTVVALVALLNAVNMIDGLDGLAGGAVVVMLGWLLVIAAIADLPEAMFAPAVLAGGLLAFLCLNFPALGRQPARVFLGDAGSAAVGLALGWIVVDLAFTRDAGVPPVVFAWVLALPILDMAVVIVRRLCRGRSPLTADREHAHHYLLCLGLSRAAATWILIAGCVMSGAVGVGGWWLSAPEWLLFKGFVLLGLVHLFVIEAVFPRVRSRLHPQCPVHREI